MKSVKSTQGELQTIVLGVAIVGCLKRVTAGRFLRRAHNFTPFPLLGLIILSSAGLLISYWHQRKTVGGKIPRMAVLLACPKSDV